MKKIYAFLFLIYISNLSFAQPGTIDGFPVPILTPFPKSVSGLDVSSISLNGIWDFRVNEQGKEKAKIQVPGEWEMQGFTINEGETAVYSKELKIPADWKGKQIKIRFDAVSSHALVKVNGKIIMEHEGSFVPFEANITNALTFKDDLLEVEVQALTVSDRLACTSQYACHTVGGLLRKATLFVVPPVHIVSNSINTIFDASFKNAKLIVQTVLSSNDASNKLSFQFILLNKEGKLVANKTVSAKATKTIIDVPSPKHWNPEQPNLYTLQTKLLLNGIVQQTNEQKIGFRQIDINGNQFLVNGKPIKLRGVNRHAVHPLSGRSISPELERKDAELFKAGNCNYIRTSHYPPSEEFLNACDELGLFVESEASLCWIQHHASPIWRTWKYTDEKFLPFMVRANMDNVLAGQKHPSVIMWSLANESRWSPLWEKVNAIVKKLDPTRPTSFHDQCWGGFNNAGSKADIANYHYPGINGPAATDTMSRPTLFGEYAHLSTYNRRELLTDPGVRSAYNAPLVKFYDSIYAHKGNLGGAIWSGIDDIFHMPDGRIVGYGPWGPLDAWRRPKPEYWGMKKAYSPTKITRINWETIKDGYIELTAENRFDFISFKNINITAKINGQAQIVTSDIPARSKGIIKVPTAVDTKELSISFTSASGETIDEEIFKVYSKDVEQINTVSLAFSENEAAIFVTQGEILYTISKTTGIILSATKKGHTVLTQGPVFCVVPMNSDNGGKPNVAGETYQNNIYPLKNYPLYTLFATGVETKKTQSSIQVNMNVTYTDGKGKQSYEFTNDGNLITTYEVQYNGQDTIPYQYGLLFQLPKQMEYQQWTRKGAFSTYPPNDIARNEGTSQLKAKFIKSVEEHGIVPAGDWKDDANEMGSNDFRATKHAITKAMAYDNIGNRVTVLSDGSQSSRTWLQDEHIQWLVADYCNTGSEPFYGSPHTEGRIKIKNKTLKGKLVIRVY